MENSPSTLIKNLAFSGKDYDQIIGVLEENKPGFSETSIELAKNKIDDHIVAFQLASQEKSKGLNQLIMGSALLIIGATITIFSYLSDKDSYILAYGAILGGAWIAKEGYKVYRMPIEDLVPRRRGLLKR